MPAAIDDCDILRRIRLFFKLPASRDSNAMTAQQIMDQIKRLDPETIVCGEAELVKIFLIAHQTPIGSEVH